MKQVKTSLVYTSLYMMYRRMFRNNILVMLISLLPTAAFTQSIFNGEWTGQILVKEENRVKQASFFFNDNQVTNHLAYTLAKGQKAKQTSQVSGNQVVYQWSHQVPYGSELETYTITAIHSDTLQVSWQRKCMIQSIKKGQKDENWSLHGTGYLLRKQEALAIQY